MKKWESNKIIWPEKSWGRHSWRCRLYLYILSKISPCTGGCFDSLRRFFLQRDAAITDVMMMMMMAGTAASWRRSCSCGTSKQRCPYNWHTWTSTISCTWSSRQNAVGSFLLWFSVDLSCLLPVHNHPHQHIPILGMESSECSSWESHWHWSCKG